ncbi:hypothetical protein CSX04_08077 [Burkholderia cepacia]|nr:hypothetical protein CSX04_08077 [Burkholderia cepacia]
MKRVANVAYVAYVTCMALLLAGRVAQAGTVDAAQYDTFWLWAGVKPQAVVRGARAVYVLQGQIEASPRDESQVRVIAQGVALPPAPHARVWLVYRAHTLRWTPRVTQIMLAQLERWRASGRTITGIQIDFDARTRHLQDYLEFLRTLRETLPADCRLSITGLLDWSSRIDTDQVNQLRGIVDEVSCRPTRAAARSPTMRTTCRASRGCNCRFASASSRAANGMRRPTSRQTRGSAVMSCSCATGSGKHATTSIVPVPRIHSRRGEPASTYTHALTPDSSTTRSRRYASTS